MRCRFVVIGYEDVPGGWSKEKAEDAVKERKADIVEDFKQDFTGLKDVTVSISIID